MSLTPRIDNLEKNYIINGDFDFWQRATSYTFGANSTIGAADRWILVYNGPGSAPTFTRSTSVPDVSSTYSIQFTAANASQSCAIHQRIESVFSRKLANKTITVSCWVRVVSASARNISLVAYTPTATDNFAGLTPVAIADGSTRTITSFAGAWEHKVWRINVPAAATMGFQIGLYSNNFTAASEIFGISQVQIVEGEQDDPEFSTAGRNYAEEFQLCQRYHERGYSEAIINTTGSVNYWFTQFFKVTKRTTPTTQTYHILNPYDPAYGNSVTDRNGNAQRTGFTYSPRVDSFTLNGSLVIAAIDRIPAFYWLADAEL